LKVFLVDPHAIYRRGVAVLLSSLDCVETVGEAGSPGDAALDPALAEADVVLIDARTDADRDLIRELRASTGARVIVCTSREDDDGFTSALRAGAVGFMRKEGLTPEALTSGVLAAQSGAGVLPADRLGDVLAGAPQRLTDREQRVLTLVADGHATSEVAHAMSYSERTVKNVLHDVVVKLNARTRSQAVACAVREGLI